MVYYHRRLSRYCRLTSYITLLLTTSSSAALANCITVGNTTTCDTAAPNPFTSTVGAGNTVAGDNQTVIVNDPPAAISTGNASAISLRDNANITVNGTVQNASTSSGGGYGTGGNTIEFRNNGTLLVGINGLVQAKGTQTSAEAVNVQGTGNTITNYGVIESTRNNVAAIWSQSAGTLTINNYGILASGNRNPGNTNTVIGGNTGAGINFINQTNAATYGSLLLGSGNDTVTLYTGSTVTGSINAGGGNDSLYLKGAGIQSLPTNVTNFSNLYKQDAGQWTLSSTLAGILSGVAPRSAQVQAGTLILTGDNSGFNGSTSVSSGAVLEGASVAIPGSVSSSGLVRFNEPGTGVYAGIISGIGAVEKIGAGVTTLTGANSYTGTTTVNSGTLKGGGANAFSANSATTINPAGTVDLGGFAQTINAVSLAGGTLTNGALTGAIVSTGGVVNSITGAASLTSASGVTTLTGTNGYTGATTVNGGTVTVVTGASLASPTGIASGGTFNNNGTMTGTVNNACGGNVNNAGSISNSVTNAGALTNTGSISGALTNNTPCGVVSNTGGLSGAITNNAVINNNSGGVISGVTANNASGVITNVGLINNTLTNTGVLTNRGAISGAVNNNAAGTITNAAAGTISGALTNSGNVQNQAGAVISGMVTNNVGAVIDNYSAINNTVANFGTLNLNGTPTVTGAISGSGVVNVNGTFTQQATIGANQVNVNSGGALNMTDSIAANTTVFGNSDLNVLGSNTITGNLVNSGTVNPRDSATNLSIDGAYSQTAGANFITRIDGLATGSYSQIISNQPIRIASGSIITAALDPALRLSPGDTVQNVIQGNGPVAQQGAINVNTVSDRYKLDYRYDGQNVDLFLPDNSSGILQRYGERGTYYGALTEKTLWSLSTIEGPATNALHQRYAILNAVMSYDCNRFDKYNFCISAQARATGFGSQATGAGVFNIAYRPTGQTRIGAFLDYQVTGGAPRVDGLSNAATLSGGSVKYGYNNPTFGGYLGFSQSGYSGNPINTGVQAFVSGGYNPGKLSITRAMIVDPNLPFVDAQPGSGSASLNAYFVRGMLGYGIGLADNLTLMPYVGLRYTDVTRGGYMESFNLLVTQPLVYNSYYERLVTGFGGGMLNGRINDKLGMMLGLGMETDFSRSANSFSGYSPLQLQADNLPFGFAHGGNWNGLRPTGMAGAYFDLAPNHRLTLNGFAGQQAWSSRGFLTGLAGYQISF